MSAQVTSEKNYCSSALIVVGTTFFFALDFLSQLFQWGLTRIIIHQNVDLFSNYVQTLIKYENNLHIKTPYNR